MIWSSQTQAAAADSGATAPAGAAAVAGGAPDSWAELSPLPTPRRLLAAAAEGGKIYTFGGCGSPCFEPPLHTDTFEETRVEVYDPATGAWSARPPIPAILFGAAAAAPGNGRIYLFGGYLTANLVLELDPATFTWTAKSPMPTPRYGLAAVALGGKVYVVGGSDQSGALEVYDPATDRWSRRAPLPTPRVFLAAAVLDGKLYALGGSPDAAGGSQSAAVEVYDPAADSWSAAAPLPAAEQLSAAAAIGGKIFAFGGFVPGAGVRGATYEYDPAANAWTARAPMPAARDQAPAVVFDGLAYVLGGSTDCHCRAVGTTESYTPPQQHSSPACVRLTKTDNRTAAAPGDTIAYQIRVSNCGAVAEAVTVGDGFTKTGLLGGLWCRGDGCSPALSGDLRDTTNLPAGGEALYTVAGSVPCGPGPGPSRLVNTACATVAGQPAVCQTDVDSVAPPTADLVVTGTAAAAVAAGETIAYHWTVANRGPCPARDVVLALQPATQFFLRDILTEAETPASPPPGQGPASGKIPCAVSSGVLACPLGTLAVGAAVPVDTRLAVPCSRQAGTLHTSANVTSGTLDVPGDDPGDEAATVTTAVAVVADYSIAFQSCPKSKIAGETVDYTARVRNAGPSCPPATVVDTLPGTITGARWCRGSPCFPESPLLANRLSYEITLMPGQFDEFSVRGTLDCPLIGDAVSNSASVALLTGSDSNPSNNATACTTKIKPCGAGPAGVAGTCLVSGPFIPGATVTYTYVLTNLGAQAQPDNPGPEFTDILPSGLTLVSATANLGVVTVNTANNTVTWDGSLPGSGGTVTIQVKATIGAGTAGTTLCNPATVFFVLNDGSQTSGPVGPCCQPVAGSVPALSGSALAALGLLLAALAVARLRGVPRAG